MLQGLQGREQKPWKPQDDVNGQVNYRLYHVIPDGVLHEPENVPPDLLGIQNRQDNPGPDVELELNAELEKPGCNYPRPNEDGIEEISNCANDTDDRPDN